MNEMKKRAIELYERALKLAGAHSPDWDEVVNLYRESANLGFAASQTNLGDLYERGCGVAQSDVVAMYWYSRAAERGEPTAYLSLANLMYKLRTDKSMLIDGMKYALWAFGLLPPGGNKDLARIILDLYTNELNSDDVSNARKMAADWFPLYQETFLQADSPRFAQK